MEKSKHPIFDRLKSVFRLFKKKPAIIELGGCYDQPTIYVANHAAANGPFTYGLYFPRRFVPWGTYEMCGNISERWNYLYHTFYRKKLKFSPLKSFLIATPFCVISKMVYCGAELIPTYKDIRLSSTIKHSIQAMQNGNSVLIFPENSEDVGYCENIDRFHRALSCWQGVSKANPVRKYPSAPYTATASAPAHDPCGSAYIILCLF